MGNTFKLNYLGGNEPVLMQKAIRPPTKENPRKAVKLPKGINRNQWLKQNIVELVESCCYFVSIADGVCTTESCPKMTAGAKYEFLWADGYVVKNPVVVSAPAYFDLLKEWTETMFHDSTLFPNDGKFPNNFVGLVSVLARRWFRIYAHYYYCHWDQLADLSLGDELNDQFKVYYLFANEFKLMTEQDLSPLQSLIDYFEGITEMPLWEPKVHSEFETDVQRRIKCLFILYYSKDNSGALKYAEAQWCRIPKNILFNIIQLSCPKFVQGSPRESVDHLDMEDNLNLINKK